MCKAIKVWDTTERREKGRTTQPVHRPTHRGGGRGQTFFTPAGERGGVGGRRRAEDGGGHIKGDLKGGKEGEATLHSPAERGQATYL